MTPRQAGPAARRLPQLGHRAFGGPPSSQAGSEVRAEGHGRWKPGVARQGQPLSWSSGYLAHLINDQLLIKSQTTGPKPETFSLSPAIWCQWSMTRTFQTQGFESTFAEESHALTRTKHCQTQLTHVPSVHKEVKGSLCPAVPSSSVGGLHSRLGTRSSHQLWLCYFLLTKRPADGP